MLEVEDRVETIVALPGIPTGSIGLVKETGHPFVVVQFEDGRLGYYASRQLRKRPAAGPPKPDRT